MVEITALWLPILLSAVFVFVVSSIIHMMLPYHRTDLGKIPSEDKVMDAFAQFNVPPGDYYFPNAGSPEAMKSQEYIDKANKGPVAFVTVLPNGIPAMGASLIQWFLYSVLVSIFAAYLTGHTVASGSDYLAVFRVTVCAAFMGYGLALVAELNLVQTQLGRYTEIRF